VPSGRLLSEEPNFNTCVICTYMCVCICIYVPKTGKGSNNKYVHQVILNIQSHTIYVPLCLYIFPIKIALMKLEHYLVTQCES